MTAGVLAVIAVGLYVGTAIRYRHDVDMGRRLAVLDHETTPVQVQAYRDELRRDAPGCGMSQATLAGAVAAARMQLPAATAWGLLSTTGGGYDCGRLMLEFMTGVRVAPSSLPAAG